MILFKEENIEESSGLFNCVFCLMIVICLLGLTACDYNVKTNDSTQSVVQSGTSYAYVVVRLDFIQQIQMLCEQSLLSSDYSNITTYNQAVAQCTLEHLSVSNVDTNQLTSFVNQYCQPNSDLSSFDPAQKTDILAACAALNSQ